MNYNKGMMGLKSLCEEMDTVAYDNNGETDTRSMRWDVTNASTVSSTKQHNHSIFTTNINSQFIAKAL